MSTNTVTLDSNSIKALASALKGAGATGGGGGGGGSGGGGGGGSFNPISVAGVMQGVTAGVGKGLELLKAQVTSNIDTWRNLSKVGANFSNDVIRMSVAANEARVSLEDFAGIIDRNAKSFAGLGGSVTRGVEAFAKLTKDFQDNDIARQMMQLGYTSTEANELLALQIGFMRTKFSMDKEAQATQFAAVNELATEMDLLAKITGQGRKEQEERLKKVKDDAAIEAKFKLIGIREGADAEKAAREKFAKEYGAAAARGQGEVFKDFFLTGSVRSKEAALQMAVGGQAAAETAKAANALAKGNTQLAEEYNKSANASMVALQKNTAYLDLVTRSGSEIGGAVSNAAGNLAKINEPLVDSVNKIIDENAKLGQAQKSYAELLVQIREDARKSQVGERKDEKGQYQQVSQATRAIIDSEKLAKDISAAVAGGAEKIFKPSIDKLGSEISASIAALQKSDIGQNVRSNVEEGVVKGLESQGKEGGALGKIAYGVSDLSDTIATGLTDVLGGLTDFFKSGDAKVKVSELPAPGQSGPTKIEADKPIPTTIQDITKRASGGPVGINGPEIVLTGEEGPEYVLNDELAERFVSSAVSKLPRPKIDTKSIAEHIRTSFSSVSGGGSTTVKRVQSDESKGFENARNMLLEDVAHYKKQAVAGMQEKLGPGTTAKQARIALKDDPEWTETLKEAETQLKELQAKIDKGISYEVERKEEAFEKAKSFIEEETKIVTAGIVDISTKVSDAAEDNFATIQDNFDELTALSVDELADRDAIEAEIEERRNEALEALAQLKSDTLATGKPGESAQAQTAAIQKIEKAEPPKQENKKIEKAEPPKQEDKKIPSINQMVQDLAKASGVKDVNKIQTGQKIKLPDGSDYVVKQGDTLSKIAQQTIKDMNSKIASPEDKTRTQTQQATQEAGRVVENQSAAETARLKQQAAKNKEQESQQPKTESISNQQKATLDDVVKSLDMLNKMMGQLISVNEDLGKQQIKAFKSNNANLYERF